MPALDPTPTLPAATKVTGQTLSAVEANQIITALANIAAALGPIDDGTTETLHARIAALETPAPTPTSSDYFSHEILTTKALLDLQPMAGTLWDQLKVEADRTDHTIAQFSDHNAPFNTQTFAKALVYARMKGNVPDGTADPYRVEVAARLQDVVDHTWATGGSTLLAYARNIAALVVAADLINLGAYDSTLDTNFKAKIAEGLTRVDATATDGFTSIRDGSMDRPNNIGMSCRLSLACGYLYAGNTADLNTYVIPPMKRWLGDTTEHVGGFNWNADQTWQVTPATSSTWVGVNAQGATRDGHTFDGIQPEDQRRGTPTSYDSADFPNTLGTPYIYNVVEMLGWLIPILDRAGYTASTWSNEAFRRSVERLIDFETNYSAKGYTLIGAGTKGNGAVAAVNAIYGTAHTEVDPPNHYSAWHGEVGWTGFLFSGLTL